MRLFTALDLPDALRERCATLRDPDALDARWSSPSQYHLTLRFIGDVEAARFPRFRDALADVDVPQVSCEPYGVDVLPSRRAPRVLMVGLQRTDSLLALHAAISEALEPLGVEPEDRTYRPHVTLARLNDAPPETVQAFLRAHDDVAFSAFTAGAFHLYESTLTPDGAVHDRRASLPLSE
jgi:2'-5' RNA ligase